ncbi:MAG: 5-carboxymethyl-2-hydroxymuconate Delta-isomerase [Gammaproteobacteria bacterium]|nr:5-carboxymethyl-2-hydroxymuconate Delta-isomerase [Gammaproteobacteria bacterium]
MPHLIVEYVCHLVTDEAVFAMIDSVHDATKETGLFVESHIKIRAIPISFYRTGGRSDPFIHAQLRIKSGRNDAQKKKLADAVLAAILQQAWPVKVTTVEVVDMDAASYAKYTSD